MTVADRKQREKEQRRNEILDAAEELFITKGFDGTSVDEIAQATELSKGTIFLYFGSKDELFISVVLRSIRTFNGKISEKVSKHRSNISKLRGVGEAVLWFSKEYPEHLELIRYFRSGRFPMGPDPSDDAKEILRMAKENDCIVMDAIRNGIAAGEIRSDMDPIALVMFMKFVTNGVLTMEPYQWKYVEDQGKTREKLVEDLWMLMKETISAGGSR